MIDLMAAAAGAAMQPVALGEIRMHLFYQGTGRLSPDISPPHPFTAANTIIGEGDAEESADDLLVAVELRSDGQRTIDEPLHIIVRGEGGAILAERRILSATTSAQGRVWLPLWVPAIGCAGALSVTATFGAQRAVESMSFYCNE
jgi:hypothetical protein